MAKIMLVEDDNNLREIYGARLLAEGHEIVTAKDGEEALATAVKEKPDLIISDVMMPRISGFDMLDILRNAPETKFTKVIMMTALSQAEDKARADNLGADRYLVKSQVTLEDVARVVRDVLDGKTEDTPQTAIVETEAIEATAPTETPGVSATTETSSIESNAPQTTDQVASSTDTGPEQVLAPPVTNPEVIPISEPAVSTSVPVTEPVATPASDPVSTTTPDPIVVVDPVLQATSPDPATASEDTPVPVAQATSQATPDPTSDDQALTPSATQAVETPAVATPSLTQPETPDQIVMPDPLDAVSQLAATEPTTQATVPNPASVEPVVSPSVQTVAEPTPAFTVQLPSQNQVIAVGAEPASLAIPVETPGPVTPTSEPSPAPSDGTSANAEAFVGPNLTQALQAEEVAAEQESNPVATPAAPTTNSTPLIGNITLPEVPQATPAPEPQSAPALPSASPTAEPSPALNTAPADTPAPVSETPATESSPAVSEEATPNPLNDESKKKLVIQPLHDLNSGPDLNALLEKEKALEAVMPPAATSIVAPQLVGNEIMPANPGQPPTSAQQNEHDNIAL